MKAVLCFLLALLLLTAQSLWSQQLMPGAGMRFASGDIRFDKTVGLDSPGYGVGVSLIVPVGAGLMIVAGSGLYYFAEAGAGDHARVVPLTIGARVGFGAGGFLPYLGFQGGVAYVRYHTSNLANNTETEHQGFMSPSFGFVIPVTSNISWDLSADYEFLFSKPQRNEFLGLNASMAFGF